jgi:alpha-L-fucosidase 2
MRNWKTGILTLTFVGFFHVLLLAGEKYQYPQKGYTSWLPATSAEHAMLLGNGEMGAMVFGHPHDETIILNHAALYLPLSEPIRPINQVARLNEIKQLILDGKGAEAAQIPVDISLEEGYNGQIWSDPYIPAFDIKLKMSAGNIEHYKRYVDFNSGEAVVEWMQGGHKFQRKQFISRSDSILVIKVTADTTFNAAISFNRRPVAWNEWDYINRNFKNTYTATQENCLFYHSEFVNQSAGSLAGYDGVGRIVENDGTLTSRENRLELTGTTSFMLVIKIESFTTEEATKSKLIKARLNNYALDYEKLLNDHQLVHSDLFRRMEFGLGDDKFQKIDAEVMNLQSHEAVTQQVIVDRFYAARYNILSATGVNPPNLQGIWGSSNRPPWSSDYTHDGNLPVAISSFLSSGMPELMMSFFDYHDARLEDYRENARKLYGCRGIQVPSHTSSRGFNVHFDPVWCLSFWNGGAPWAAHFYYDYWLYSRDTTFLASRAFPFMKETALFFEDFLHEDDNGKLFFNPSYSPENNPLNHSSQATINATMDVMLVKELLRNTIETGLLLNEPAEQLQKWELMLQKLPAYEVDSNGFLREWLWPGYIENHNHRHISQLYGMYNRPDPEIIASTQLREGVLKVLEEKLRMRKAEDGGIMVFGLAQMAWVAANLGDAAMVEDIIHMLNARYWSNSMATYHDPDGLFNMDLSGGYQTVIIKALLYADDKLLSLFPAKPASWEKGFIRGIAAHNRIMVTEMKWDQQKLEISLISPIGQTINIAVPENYELPKIIDDQVFKKIFEQSNLFGAYIKPNETLRISFINTKFHE